MTILHSSFLIKRSVIYQMLLYTLVTEHAAQVLILAGGPSNRPLAGLAVIIGGALQ